MIHLVLWQPEIPPNTGNIIRLAANTGATLHLVRPLGFSLDDTQLRRAGLDYHEYAKLQVHDDFAAVQLALADAFAAGRCFAFTTKGSTRYDQVRYADGDVLLFGPESRGLPAEILDHLPPKQRLVLPQQPGMRSLNLSNAVAVAVYEAWRQSGFVGAAASAASTASITRAGAR
jgi:tRNA (cytidine/uridine-2'-O-)-methyltransferase